MFGEVLTFCSVKMGVGRSMALASIAWILAQHGKRVLVIDWDFDNPNVQEYLASPLSNDSKERLKSSLGLIDLCWALVVAARAEDQQHNVNIDGNETPTLSPYITTLEYGFSNGGRLDIMLAGQQGRKFNVRVRYFSWSEFYDRLQGTKTLNAAFDWLVTAYDYILIDSPSSRFNSSFPFARTDKLIACLTLDEDSIRATARAIGVIKRSMGVTSRIYPIPMRTQHSEFELLNQFRAKARQVFAPYLTYLHDGNENQYWSSVEIPEIPYYAFAHQLPTLTESADDPGSLSAAYHRFVAYLTDPSATKSVQPGENATGEFQETSGDDNASGWRMLSRPYEGEEDCGFVSYARDDVHMVMPIVQDIADLEYHLWWDEGIPGAIEWLPHLEEKIQESKYLLLFLSQRAVASKYVQKEIEIAKQNQKTILGIRLDRTSLPQPIQELLGEYQLLDVSAIAFEENLGRTLALIHRQKLPATID